MKVFKALLKSALVLLFIFNTHAEEVRPSINLEAIQSIERLIEGKNERIEVAYCYSVVCCKTVSNGAQFCKESCNYCPPGWMQQ